jgi:hypothetical protein
MIALFPAQLQGAVSPAPAKAGGKEKKKKGPAKQAPTNPLSGSPEKVAFDAAKKAVAKATKDAGGQKLAANHPLVSALESAKDKYFRALSSTKGTKSEDDDSSSDEEKNVSQKGHSLDRLAAAGKIQAKANKSPPRK